MERYERKEKDEKIWMKRYRWVKRYRWKDIDQNIWMNENILIKKIWMNRKIWKKRCGWMERCRWKNMDERIWMKRYGWKDMN